MFIRKRHRKIKEAIEYISLEIVGIVWVRGISMSMLCEAMGLDDIVEVWKQTRERSKIEDRGSPALNNQAEKQN